MHVLITYHNLKKKTLNNYNIKTVLIFQSNYLKQLLEESAHTQMQTKLIFYMLVSDRQAT